MSNKTYTPEALVTLPRVSASGARALIQSVLTAASEQAATLAQSGQSLPTAIERSRARLFQYAEALALALMPTEPVDNAATRQADTNLDRSWSALRDLVKAWKKLPAPPNPFLEDAERLDSVLFSEGLTFLKLEYVEQWQASQSRLEALKADALRASVVKLGAVLFVEHILAMHADYGAALGITATVSVEPSAAVQTTLMPALGALRDYVTKVSAWADPEEPGSEALSQALLQPLVSWDR